MTLTVVVGSAGSGKTAFINDVVYSTNRRSSTYLRQCHRIRPYILVSKIPNFDPTRLPYWHIYQRQGTAHKLRVGSDSDLFYGSSSSSSNRNSNSDGIATATTRSRGNPHNTLTRGERKLLLFELLCQRTYIDGHKSDLFLCMDEPFSSVTDDYRPFVLARLDKMSAKHNVVLVTNDHIPTLSGVADNVITLTAETRTHASHMYRSSHAPLHSYSHSEITFHVDNSTIDARRDRETLVEALCVGENHVYQATWADLRFFWDTEVIRGVEARKTILCAVVCLGIVLATFGDEESFAFTSTTTSTLDEESLSRTRREGGSARDHADAIFVAIQFLTLVCHYPYLSSLVCWRDTMLEEADALVHSSRGMNKFLKLVQALFLIVGLSGAAYGMLYVLMEDFQPHFFFIAILMDTVSLVLPFVCLSLFTRYPEYVVRLIGCIPVLAMVLFSTTFAPGAGLPYVTGLRYIFPRFFTWCMIPSVQNEMENCPDIQADFSDADLVKVIHLVLSGMVGPVIFGICKLVGRTKDAIDRTVAAILSHEEAVIRSNSHHKRGSSVESELKKVQIELFGEADLRHLLKDNHLLGRTPVSASGRPPTMPLNGFDREVIDETMQSSTYTDDDNTSAANTGGAVFENEPANMHY